MNDNQITLDNINNFINNANQTLSCDTNCQKMQKENELKKIYLDSITNTTSSSAQQQIAYKNYIIATQGEEVYNDNIDKQLNEKANIIADAYKNNFDTNMYNTELSLGTYKGLLINFQNIIDYYISYADKNVNTYNNNRIKVSDVLTNERKTYYENQNIERIQLINKILFYLYFLIVILFLIFMFIFPANLSYIKLIIILIILVIYPFMSSKIFTLIVNIYNFIVNNILPKNVYKTI